MGGQFHHLVLVGDVMLDQYVQRLGVAVLERHQEGLQDTEDALPESVHGVPGQAEGRLAVEDMGQCAPLALACDQG